MSAEKLKSDEVPQKFTEWLLAMGCPQENVPPLDKITEMCRGQYYMVWRSLIEHVGPKDTIKNKRLQVFTDDVIRCQAHAFHKRDPNVVVPEELSLWKQQSELKKKLVDAESRVQQEKEKLQLLTDKISSKLSHRNLSRKKVVDTSRRAWLLRQLADELRDKRANLLETKAIAESLCCLDDGADVENKVDKCLTAMARQNAANKTSLVNPAACSSIISTNSDNTDAEEQILSLVKCRGDVLYKQLFERRARLCSEIANAPTGDAVKKNNRITPQSILARTSGLHCTLALEAVKNKIHVKQARERLAVIVNDMNNCLTGEACELLVLRCERARTEARLASLRTLTGELTSREGIFTTDEGKILDTNASKHIHNVDKIIESRRDELKRLMTSAVTVQRKTHNVKECLFGLFNSFHSDTRDNDIYTGPTSLPSEPISSIRQFYEEKQERSKNKMELSMDLDASDSGSFTELIGNTNPRFVDELKIYLKKFSLDNNRKLVLESGQKIWIFETVQSALDRLRASLLADDIHTSLLCPSVTLTQHLIQLEETIEMKHELEQALVTYGGGMKGGLEIDISSRKEEEDKNIDKIKKKLNENILMLEKTEKNLDVGLEHLKFWSDNNIRKYISEDRTVDGKTYKEFEQLYLESLQM